MFICGDRGEKIKKKLRRRHDEEHNSFWNEFWRMNLFFLGVSTAKCRARASNMTKTEVNSLPLQYERDI